MDSLDNNYLPLMNAGGGESNGTLLFYSQLYHCFADGNVPSLRASEVISDDDTSILG